MMYNKVLQEPPPLFFLCKARVSWLLSRVEASTAERAELDLHRVTIQNYPDKSPCSVLSFDERSSKQKLFPFSADCQISKLAS